MTCSAPGITAGASSLECGACADPLVAAAHVEEDRAAQPHAAQHVGKGSSSFMALTPPGGGLSVKSRRQRVKRQSAGLDHWHTGKRYVGIHPTQFEIQRYPT